MGTCEAVEIAVTFVWLGMVLAISFLEAPLKFGAPGVTVRIGLAIGRRVFRALNTAEVVLALALLITAALGPPPVPAAVALALAAAALLVQLVAVRPRLNRRTEAVLAGADAPRSRGHLAYVGVEAAKVVALAAGGIALLAG